MIRVVTGDHGVVSVVEGKHSILFAQQFSF